MSMEYIRKTYSVPCRRGQRVKFTGDPFETPLFGTIVSARSQYVSVRMDGKSRIYTLHPTWKLEYLPPASAGDA